MRRYTVTGHMVVKNEARWIWFSILSVINFVDRMIIFYTGSTDGTVEIIREIMRDERYARKIIFEEKKGIHKDNFYLIRQEQIERTNTDYFFVVDGDEIWYKDALDEVETILTRDTVPDLIAVRFINCAGDMYHYRNFDREKYCINGITGSVTIRFYSMHIEGIKCSGQYGIEGYVDGKNLSVQNGQWRIENIVGQYLHMSMLQRSGKIMGDLSIGYRLKKFHRDWDQMFSVDFKYPEVFYSARPEIVFNPWLHKVGVLDRVFCFLRRCKRFLMG